MLSGLLHVCDTKQNSADWLLQHAEEFSPLPQREAAGFHYAPLSCFSQCQLGQVASLQTVISRWLYRTQTDACGSRAIEWFRRLAHGCWPSLPTYRISCDAGSDDLLGKMRHPVCSMSATPSKVRLIGFCYKWRVLVHCHREKQQGSTTLHSAVSHNGNEVRLLVFK